VEPPRVLSISVPYELQTLDPHAENLVSEMAVHSHFYESLVTTDPEMRIRPCLARHWENPDASTWIFHIRPGIRFHDGRPLRAEDVVYSIRRPLASPALRMRTMVTGVEDVRVSGPLAVQVRTVRPLSVLLNRLRFIAIVPEGSSDQALRAAPNGTGPFVLRERTGDTLRMSRNESYWGPRPAFAAVEWRLARTTDQALSDLLSGRSRLVQANATTIRERLTGDRRFEVVSRPSVFVKYLGFDVSRARTPYTIPAGNPFRDRRVREAIHVGLDRRALAAALPFPAVPATQPVPPFTFGFNPRIEESKTDAAHARALLRAAGLSGGFQAVLHTRRMFADAALLIRDQLEPLGVRLRVEIEDDPDFLARARRRDTSLFLSRLGAVTGDASDVLDIAFHTADPTGFRGSTNYGGYSNAEVDRGIVESSEADSVSRRRALLEQVMERLMFDLPWVPLYTDEDVYAFDRSLRWKPRYDGFLFAFQVELAAP
jgi:peptide/nickel transport system substrate-binding protein